MHHPRPDHSPSPTPAGRDHLRVSDTERERAATSLREHTTAGRLTIDELDGRLETALAARTQRELDALFEDLPAQPHRGPSSRDRAKALGVRIHIGAYLWASLAMIAIWAATGTGYVWPLWPILGWGIGVASHTGACGFGYDRLRRQR
ncbi:MAG TPA: DUF1707 domain-containing protein [Solirubrobacteraceae bacterium]|jgi:hypothetical protein|nr:DUF1707 domain-containing protein [Solirubrobacteraceae bacterium]